MSMDIDILDYDGVLRKFGLEDGGRVQLAFDNAVYRGCQSYTPFDTGTLARSVNGIGTGRLEYAVPYAHYQYVGTVYAPNIPIYQGGEIVGWWSPPNKKPTDRKLNYNTFYNPLAGDHWFERAKADLMQSWIDEARGAIDQQ